MAEMIDYKATAGYGKPFVRPMDKDRKFGEWRGGKHAANPAEAQALVAEIDQLKALLADSVPQSAFVALAEEKGAEVREFATYYKESKALLEKYQKALEGINAIRNSIVGRQAINWSSHIYPLVQCLQDAGFESEGSTR